MRKTKQISITLSADALLYLEKLAEINCRTRSAMLEWLLQQEKQKDDALDEEARYYDKNNRII